jgi:hypothetical protein
MTQYVKVTPLSPIFSDSYEAEYSLMHWLFPEGGIDLDKYTFEEFVAFVFDHPIKGRRWYESKRWKCCGTPERMLQHLTQLFQEPEFLVERYTKGQLKQGFWYIGSKLGLLHGWLWDEAIDWEQRRRCILSMASLEQKLFAQFPLDETCFMWWDFYRCFDHNPSQHVTEAMLDALERTLQIPETHCQESALHGLGHLEHPHKTEIITAYLAAHPNLPNALRQYALAALTGDIL